LKLNPLGVLKEGSGTSMIVMACPIVSATLGNGVSSVTVTVEPARVMALILADGQALLFDAVQPRTAAYPDPL
jgi:hypothetical protein